MKCYIIWSLNTEEVSSGAYVKGGSKVMGKTV